MAKVMRHRVHREPHVLTVTLRCSCGYWIRAVRGLALIEAEDEMDSHVVAFDNLREAITSARHAIDVATRDQGQR